MREIIVGDCNYRVAVQGNDMPVACPWGVVTVGGREISEHFYSYFLDQLPRVPLS